MAEKSNNVHIHSLAHTFTHILHPTQIPVTKTKKSNTKNTHKETCLRNIFKVKTLEIPFQIEILILIELPILKQQTFKQFEKIK